MKRRVGYRGGVEEEAGEDEEEKEEVQVVMVVAVWSFDVGLAVGRSKLGTKTLQMDAQQRRLGQRRLADPWYSLGLHNLHAHAVGMVLAFDVRFPFVSIHLCFASTPSKLSCLVAFGEVCATSTRGASSPVRTSVWRYQYLIME